MPCQCGYPDGMSPRGRMVFPRAELEGKPSSRGETFHQDTHTGMACLFYCTKQTQFGKISMTGGHDGIANLCKPITAYDFHVRYNNSIYLLVYIICNISNPILSIKFILHTVI